MRLEGMEGAAAAAAACGVRRPASACLAKVRDVHEGLKQRVHVARRALVLQPDVPRLLLRVPVPGLGRLDADGAPDVLAFGAQLKDRPFSREIVVTNNSRVIQQLVWKNVTADEKRRAAVAWELAAVPAMISPSGAQGFPDGQDGRRDGYRVRGRARARHRAPQDIRRVYAARRLRAGGGDFGDAGVPKRERRAHERGEVMTVHATASVTVPLLAFREPEMGFEYSHDPEVDGDLLPRVETRPPTFRNASRTPVTFALRCDRGRRGQRRGR